jgi:2-amino-4-hydroxy-6-hydroxymethyldihydropteridine diphosphokinase
MSDKTHDVYLNLGSNIEPELHLPEAVRLLGEHGQIRALSNAWQSHAFWTDGPDFLNACVLIQTSLGPDELLRRVIRPIEAALGRERGPDENAPRTIDIDIVLFNEEPVGEDGWSHPFVVVPLAELLPDFHHPHAQERLDKVAEGMRRQTWIVACPDILNSE